MFTTRTLELMDYNRKHWMPFRLQETLAATPETATSYCPIREPLTAVRLVGMLDAGAQQATFALRHHDQQVCSCQYCESARIIWDDWEASEYAHEG